jgi:prepilin-type N-terminal cleavage/methylation domain-containing protein
MVKKYKAFTLIELLVVIAIVGVLSGFIFVSMSSAINSAKDAKRKADLSSIEKALLVYGANHGGTYPYSALDTYPCNLTGSTNLCTNTNLSAALSPYLGVLPIDPNGTSYTYTGVADASSFVLTGTLSNGNSYYYSSPNLTWTETTSPFIGWGYKKTVTLSSTLTQDYQVKLTIPFGVGGCESHCNADFSDLRFASTGGTVLNYWIESYTASTTATVWVKALNGSSSFNMYYGKTGTATTANGDNTFEFFDEFNSGSSLNLTKWNATSSTTSISSGIMTITGAGATPYISTISTWGPGYANRMRWKQNQQNRTTDFLWRTSGSNNYVVMENYNSSWYSEIAKQGVNYEGVAASDTSWHIYDGLWANNYAAIVKDGTVFSSTSNTNYIPIANLNTTLSNDPAGGVFQSDYALVRKYQNPEPAPTLGGETIN